MSRRSFKDRNIRKIVKLGNSYAVTIPLEIIKKFRWREKQKVIVTQKGKIITITDWHK